MKLTEIYNSIPTIPYEGDDEPIHTNTSPWCQDSSCPCHSGQRNWDYEEGRGYIPIDHPQDERKMR